MKWGYKIVNMVSEISVFYNQNTHYIKLFNTTQHLIPSVKEISLERGVVMKSVRGRW